MSQSRCVLLTGAGGFIGRQAIPALLARGFEVHAVSKAELPVAIAHCEGVVFHKANLLDPNETREIMQVVKPSHLLHFAWYTAHGKFWQSPENLKWVSASLDLFSRFAEIGGERSVFAGTCAEYEWSESLLVEDSPRRPATLYGVCKNELHEIYAAAARNYGVSAGWGRIFLPYGPHEDSRRIVPSAISQLLRGLPAEFTHGKQLRDLIHVEDLAGAFVALLSSSQEGPMNLGSGEPIELKEVVERIGHLIGRPELLRIGARPTRDGDPMTLIPNVTLMKSSLQFEPRYSLDAGLKSTLAWWQEQIKGSF